MSRFQGRWPEAVGPRGAAHFHAIQLTITSGGPGTKPVYVLSGDVERYITADQAQRVIADQTLGLAARLLLEDEVDASKCMACGHGRDDHSASGKACIAVGSICYCEGFSAPAATEDKKR